MAFRWRRPRGFRAAPRSAAEWVSIIWRAVIINVIFLLFINLFQPPKRIDLVSAAHPINDGGLVVGCAR
jgi:hypothetical protein